MPLAIPTAVRRAILRRHQRGQTARHIAAVLQLSERTVRHLLQRLRNGGAEALQPDYPACGPHRQRDRDLVRQRTLQLRSQHPRWGAGRLLVQLKKLLANHDLPSERTLQRWLRHEGEHPAPAGRPPQERRPRSTVLHEVWQIDAAEQKRLANGSLISWLRVYEECSGAVLKTVVFPPRAFQLRATDVGADAFEAGFSQARPASDHPRGQWLALGVGRGFADRVRVVAHRARYRDLVEPAASASRQRHRRTRSRVGQELGRTAPLS